MPTGLTSIIDDKENCTFEEFAWRCARGTCAFLHQRDDDINSEIIIEAKPDDYYLKKKTNLRKEWDDFLKLDEQELKRKYRSEVEETRNEDLRREEERSKLAAKYDAMKKRVLAWKPPTAEHEEFKNMMLDQLRIGRPYPYRTPSYPTFSKWKKDKLDSFESYMEYYEKEYNKEVKRVSDLNTYRRKLLESLGPPPQGIK